MPDKLKLKPRKPASNNNTKQAFFSPSSIGKKKKGASFSLMGSGVPAPHVKRTAFGISATVYFDKNSAFLNSQNFEAVKKLSEDLKYLYKPKVVVNGHASQEGSESVNQALSERRRELVLAILKSTEKMNPVQYEGQAFGESQPTMPEEGDTQAEKEGNRKYNRRAEIIILFDPSTIEQEGKGTPSPDRATPGDPGAPLPGQLPPRFRYYPSPEDLERWRQEDFQRRLWQTPYVPPYKKQSLNELLWKKFDKTVDRALRKMKVPERLRPLIRKGARKAIEKGAESLLDHALDQTGLGNTEKKAIKKAVEAAGKTELFPR